MKTILISGTSSGIGHDLCVQALKLNLNVISISRNIDPTLSLPGVVSYSIDITKKEQIDELKKDLERKKVKIDILVNNAGFLKKELFQDSSIDSFRNTYNVNVFGLAELTRQLLPLINRSGHVVNISSIGGVNGSKKFPGLAVYSSSKSAVIGLTEVLAEEFPSGPSFNVLALGSVNTKMLNEAFPDYKAQTDSKEMAEYILDFALNGNKLFNGKLISVSKTNP